MGRGTCSQLGGASPRQPTVSHHLKVLHEAGLLERQNRATWVYYRLPADRLPSICAALLWQRVPHDRAGRRTLGSPLARPAPTVV